MLLFPPLPCNRPDDGADGDSGEWTGEKRRRHLGPSLPSGTGEVADARISSSSSDASEERVPDLEDPIINDEEVLEYDEEEPLEYDEEEFMECVQFLSKRRQIRVSHHELLDLETQRELYKDLVHWRNKAHELLKGECKATLCEPAFLEHAVSVYDLHILVDHYFCYLDEEEGGTIECYFDSKSKFEELGDAYCRLVLKNYLPNEGLVYRDWELYSSLFTTYEMDKDYVNFVEEVSSKLEWLKSGFGYPEKSDMWQDMRNRGALQALKIAKKKYTHMNTVLVYTAYEEYIWRLRLDYLYCEGKDDLFLEIRKHVTNGQLTFEAALAKLDENLFPRHKNLMQRALQKDMWCGLEEEYNSCVEGIPGDASEDEAKDLIRAAVRKFHEPKKPLHKYMERKMEIARNIGLV